MSDAQENIAHMEVEYNRLIRILDFRLPPSFKRVGLLGATVLMLFLLGSKFLDYNSLIVKDVLRTVILLFLLLASLSQDPVEDEYIKHVRFQSYVIAFVSAVVYSISIPLIAVILDLAIVKMSGDGIVDFYEVSAFEVLFILMGLQLLFFETLKRFGRA